jgi:hypothetical protein
MFQIEIDLVTETNRMIPRLLNCHRYLTWNLSYSAIISLYPGTAQSVID